VGLLHGRTRLIGRVDGYHHSTGHAIREGTTTVLAIIGLLIIGLIAGAIARFLVPGRDPLGFLGTALLGIVGSFVGGLLWSLITGDGLQFQTVGLIGSIIGAVIALLLYRSLVGGRARA
jgi:uncharacterized membrane protein YeaQ/YmgE (transglycosylase-associated protein family)